MAISVRQQIEKIIGVNPSLRQILEIKSGALIYLSDFNLDFTKEIFLVVSTKNHLTIIDDHQKVFGNNASVRLNLITNTNSNVDYLVTSPNLNSYQAVYQAYPGRDSKFTFYLLGKLFDANYQFTCAINHRFNGSIGNIVSAFAFNNKSKSSINLISNHQGQGTAGDIKFKGLGCDEARALAEGMIAIGKKAANTNSYLQQDVLLISPTAGVDAKPNLEILNNEVKASHGATLSSFDKAALFYLYSRGLNETQAEQLIVDGFFDSLVSKVENKVVVDSFKKFWQNV